MQESKKMGHVGIIGGGVTGLAAALSLSKIGFHLDRRFAVSDEQKLGHFPLLRKNFHETLPFLL